MKFWIWLAILKTLSPKQKNNLLDVFKTPEKIFKADKDELEKLCFLNEFNIDEILINRDLKLIAKYEEYMKKHDISMLNITDNKYPLKLRNIYDPPISIFLKGNIDLLDNCAIAVIGCRNASKYGLNIAKKFAYDLACENIVIVSGMARGIDGEAHKGAIEASQKLKSTCKTIAVLGSGVDYPYPSENIEVYKNIIDNGGLILSEYIIGTRPLSSNFPSRNRIISALSDGVLVVEAKKQSGTMITVDFALEQGKEVYIIPGNIDSLNSEGTNDLIKQGAKLVSTKEDILEDF